MEGLNRGPERSRPGGTWYLEGDFFVQKEEGRVVRWQHVDGGEVHEGVPLPGLAVEDKDKDEETIIDIDFDADDTTE